MQDDRPRIFGIIPAAGRSRRMGAVKQLLDVGGRIMLLDVLEPIVAAGVDGAVVVTYQDVLNRIDLSHLSSVHLAINRDPDSEMIDSVRIGIETLDRCNELRDRDGILVCPADHPGISAKDFKACMNGYRTAATSRIIVGARSGRRGHPMIFPAALRNEVASDACRHGLRGLLSRHDDMVQLVECQSPGILRDVDTPEALRDIREERSRE